MGNKGVKEREAGTQELVAEARRETNGLYNIVVIDIERKISIKGIANYLYKTIEKEICGHRYKIYIFMEGTFEISGTEEWGYKDSAYWGRVTEEDTGTDTRKFRFSKVSECEKENKMGHLQVPPPKKISSADWVTYDEYYPPIFWGVEN